MSRYYYYEGFGEAADVTGNGLEVEAGKTPFYLRANPVAAAITSIQKSLGVPETGLWDPATQNMLWNWLMARETIHTGVSDLPPTVPWRAQVCVADGFPMREQDVAVEAAQAKYAKSVPTAPDCIDTSALMMDVLEEYIRSNPALVNSLGWPSYEAMQSDAAFQAVADSIGLNLAAHIRSQLMAVTPPPPPLPCPTGQVRDPVTGTCGAPVVVTPPATQQPTMQSASVGWIIGGLVAAGFLVWAFSRKPEAPMPPSMPEG